MVLSLKSVSIISIGAIFAGSIASMIGIGGGILYIPMLLKIGYPPFVASSTSLLIVMYAAAGNVLAYSLAGKMLFTSALWLAMFTCIGVIIGNFHV